MGSSVTSSQQLGLAIRRRRKEVGLTQQALAGLAGVGNRFLSELERGKPTSQLGKTFKVLQLLGFDLYVSPRR